MKEIIITYFLGYFIIFLACGFYTILGFSNLDSFMQGPCAIIVVIYFVIVSIYLFFHNRKIEPKVTEKEIFPCIYFGFSFSIFFNMIIFYFYNGNSNENISLWISFISSGIVGPIYEEILFRYIFYNRLKKRFSVRKSIFISSFVFGIIHLNFIKSIYSFIFGIFLSSFYEKKENIIVPILIHITANSVVLFLNGFDVIVLCLSFINLIISSYLLFY